MVCFLVYSRSIFHVWQILTNIKNLHIPQEFRDFELALLALRELDLLVSNPVLPTNYREVIQAWKDAWDILFSARNITYPNKIHIINHHLEVCPIQQ